MAIPEDYGGAGFGMLEVGMVLEEMGRALTPAPFLSSVVLGANAVLIGGTDQQKHRLLPGVASGERRLALATVDIDAGWDPDPAATIAATTATGWELNGAKSHVVDGLTADTLIVAAGVDSEQIDLFVVDAETEGVSRSPLATMDLTRKQASIEFTNVHLGPEARLGASGSGSATLAALFDLAAVALAFDQLGGAQRCLEMSVDYAKERYQFGRPIGSFQAVKHKCADMLVAVEGARSAAYYAGWAAAMGDPDLPVAAAVAKAYCSDAYFDVAAETIQIHGGVGFTWEHDAHLYFKRAKTDQLLFGDAAIWRSKLAERVGL
jgi:alkylation response protein AidB-like acyl-CoA dehydrogenase